MFLDSYFAIFIFRSWFDLLDVLTFLIFILNFFQIISKFLTKGYRYHNLREILKVIL